MNVILNRALKRIISLSREPFFLSFTWFVSISQKVKILPKLFYCMRDGWRKSLLISQEFMAYKLPICHASILCSAEAAFILYIKLFFFLPHFGRNPDHSHMKIEFVKKELKENFWKFSFLFTILNVAIEKVLKLVMCQPRHIILCNLYQTIISYFTSQLWAH